MDLGFTEEQEILKKSAHNFLARECPKQMTKELDESETGFSPELWRKMADLGWMGSVLPEEYGGSGGHYIDLIVLLEEMGFNLLPGPFFSTMVLGALPILRAGTEKQKAFYLPAIAGGKKIVTMALTEASGKYDAASVTVRATPSEDGYIINGLKLFVPDAHLADYILCVARTKDGADPQEGLTLFIIDREAPGIRTTLLKTLARDKQTEVVFDHVKVDKDHILGELDRGWPVVKDVLQQAAVAKAAELVGHSQAALEMAVNYAKERIQFGRPIGSFQAIQHYCANMLSDVDSARYLTYEAAWMISEGLEAVKQAAMAKAWAGDASRRVTLLAHQIFGAIGFTMEFDIHLYYRRALAGSQAFGDSDYQREIVAAALGL